MSDTQSDDPRVIYIPEPEGHPRAALVMENGHVQAVDEDQATFAGRLRRFLEGDEQLLVFTEPQYGKPVYLTREGARRVNLVAITWLRKVAPKPSKGIVVADRLPGVN